MRECIGWWSNAEGVLVEGDEVVLATDLVVDWGDRYGEGDYICYGRYGEGEGHGGSWFLRMC